MCLNVRVAPNMLTRSNNIPNVSGWSLESGYNPKADHRKYPKNTLDSGQKNELDLILSAFEHDHEYKCFGSSYGFDIAIFSPSDDLGITSRYFLLELSKSYRLSLEPKYKDISEGLSKYKPNQRQCFFNAERKLHFYKTYTQSNCENECFVNFTLQRCGCVPPFMPSMLL